MLAPSPHRGQQSGPVGTGEGWGEGQSALAAVSTLTPALSLLGRGRQRIEIKRSEANVLSFLALLRYKYGER